MVKTVGRGLKVKEVRCTSTERRGLVLAVTGAGSVRIAEAVVRPR